MNPAPFDLNTISVKSPCTVPWSGMTGDERTRHCKLCKLNVYNLSEMTRADAEALLAEREGRVCVRYVRRADGTIQTRDCSPIRAARARRIFALTAATAVVMFVQAMSWWSKREGRDEKYDAHQSFQTSRSSHAYQRIPMVRKVVDWAEQKVNNPGPVIMGKRAAMGMVMGDVAYTQSAIPVTTPGPQCPTPE